MFVITVFGRQRQADPWVSYLSLLRELQPVREPASKHKRDVT